MRPLIGIPPGLDDRGRWRTGRSYQYLDAAYANALSAAGGAPLLLPLQDAPEALVERLDGLLLPGGDDFPPDRPYPAEVCFEPVPARQLAFDRALLSAALERDLPVLGICYGMQLLALQAGGSLHHDVSTDVASAGPHQLPEADGRHPLAVVAGSRLADLLGRDPGPVNSLHHQAVSDPGPGARVSARAGDGLIEAIELPDRRFALGVQWHPEKLQGPHTWLFDGFVALCR